MVIVTSASQDNFRAFGFSRGQEVTWKQVEKAFRRRSVEVHPDRGGDEEEFKRLQAAHELVKKLYQMAPVTAATHATFLVLDIDAIYEQIPWSTVQKNFDGKLKFYMEFFGTDQSRLATEARAAYNRLYDHYKGFWEAPAPHRDGTVEERPVGNADAVIEGIIEGMMREDEQREDEQREAQPQPPSPQPSPEESPPSPEPQPQPAPEPEESPEPEEQPAKRHKEATDDDDLEAAYTIHIERVNVRALEDLMKRAACRRAANGWNLFDMLDAIMARVRNVRRGVGEITVVLRQTAPKAGFEARYITGGAVPETEHERVPEAMKGLSLFAFPKVVRVAARTGFGLLTVDIKNSIFQLQFRRHQPPLLREYVERRDEKLKQLAVELREKTGFRATPADVKKVIIAIGFGKRAEAAIHDLTGVFVPVPWIEEFAEEQRVIRGIDARANPDLMDALAGKRNPQVSAQYYIYADTEVKLLRKMCEVAGTIGKLECREHDGCVIETKLTPEALQEAMLDLGVEVAVTTEPDIEQAPLRGTCGKCGKRISVEPHGRSG